MLDGGSSAIQCAPDDGTTRSLIQTRNLTAREERKLSRAISRLQSSKTAEAAHSLLSVMAAVGLAISFFALLDFSIDALLAGVEFPQKVLFGFVIGGGAFLAIVVRRFIGTARHHGFLAGNRYGVEPCGFSVVVRGVSTFYPWRCVRELKVSADHILLHVSDAETVALCKAAFGGQDVDGFSAELERVWRQDEAPAPSSASDREASAPNANSPVTRYPHALESTFELRQTRELTKRERREFMRLLRNNQPYATRRGWFRAMSLLWWLAAAWFSFAVVTAINKLGPTAPVLAWQLAVAALAFWILLLGIGRATDYLRAKRMKQRDIGNTFVIEPDGICARSNDGHFKAYWRGIPAMVESPDYLFVTLNETVGSIIVKSAFDGQDVATFCAEAQRRWKVGHRDPAP